MHRESHINERCQIDSQQAKQSIAATGINEGRPSPKGVMIEKIQGGNKITEHADALSQNEYDRGMRREQEHRHIHQKGKGRKHHTKKRTLLDPVVKIITAKHGEGWGQPRETPNRIDLKDTVQ